MQKARYFSTLSLVPMCGCKVPLVSHLICTSARSVKVRLKALQRAWSIRIETKVLKKLQTYYILMVVIKKPGTFHV
jgi:hypothetical protein